VVLPLPLACFWPTSRCLRSPRSGLPLISRAQQPRGCRSWSWLPLAGRAQPAPSPYDADTKTCGKSATNGRPSTSASRPPTPQRNGCCYPRRKRSRNRTQLRPRRAGRPTKPRATGSRGLGAGCALPARGSHDHDPHLGGSFLFFVFLDGTHHQKQSPALRVRGSAST
jgi:hypothetical protein